MIAFGDPRLPERFWRKVHPSGGSCWEWQGARSDTGYGRYRLGDRMVIAHRVAFEALIAPIPDGLYILHGCDNPPCVNPAHLRAGTRADNMRDCVERGRYRNQHISKTNCPAGHPYDEINTYRDPRGQRQCRTCRAEHKRRYRRRNIGANHPKRRSTRREKP